jgi:hypothetical protein
MGRAGAGAERRQGERLHGHHGAARSPSHRGAAEPHCPRSPRRPGGLHGRGAGSRLAAAGARAVGQREDPSRPTRLLRGGQRRGVDRAAVARGPLARRRARGGQSASAPGSAQYLPRRARIGSARERAGCAERAPFRRARAGVPGALARGDGALGARGGPAEGPAARHLPQGSVVPLRLAGDAQRWHARAQAGPAAVHGVPCRASRRASPRARQGSGALCLPGSARRRLAGATGRTAFGHAAVPPWVGARATDLFGLYDDTIARLLAVAR